MPKDLASLIRDSAASAGERKVAAALLEGFPFQALTTVESLAGRAGVSNPTVLRYLARLGFARFADFQARVLAEMRRQAGSPLEALDAPEGNGAHPYQAALLRQAEALRRTAEAAVPAEFDAFVALLAHPRHRILCLGGRYSQNLARRLSRQLVQVRADVQQLEPAPGFLHEPVLDMGARDVLVLFDYPRYQPDLLALAQLARQAGARIALFTDTRRSPIAALAHAVLTAKEAMISPFSSRIVATAQIETVVAAVLGHDRAAARKRLERIEDLRNRLDLLTRQAEEAEAAGPEATGMDGRPDAPTDAGDRGQATATGSGTITRHAAGGVAAATTPTASPGDGRPKGAAGAAGQQAGGPHAADDPMDDGPMDDGPMDDGPVDGRNPAMPQGGDRPESTANGSGQQDVPGSANARQVEAPATARQAMDNPAGDPAPATPQGHDQPESITDRGMTAPTSPSARQTEATADAGQATGGMQGGTSPAAPRPEGAAGGAGQQAGAASAPALRAGASTPHQAAPGAAGPAAAASGTAAPAARRHRRDGGGSEP